MIGWARGVGFAVEQQAHAELKWLKKHNSKTDPREYRLVSIETTRTVDPLDDEIDF